MQLKEVSTTTSLLPIIPFMEGASASTAEMTPEMADIVARNYVSELQALTSDYGIQAFDIDPEIERVTGRIERKTYRDVNASSLPQDIKKAFRVAQQDTNAAQLATAGSYYQEMIRPLLAEGRDGEIFKPGPEDIKSLCKMIASQDGANFVLYYALSKTKSPRRTGSPNTIIDMAEVEMLKYYALMGRVAEKMGLSVRFTIVDESSALPDNDPLGFSPEEKIINRRIGEAIVEEFGAKHLITFRSLKESTADVLGEEFFDLYAQKYDTNLAAAREQVETNQTTALKVRAFTFLEFITDEALVQFGITTEEQLQSIRALSKYDDLTQLPSDLLDYLIKQTAEFASVMDLRSEAAEKVRSIGLMADFPEYNPANRIYAGITSSTNRLSFKPHPKPSLGRKINPMHGLVLYNGQNGSYIGIAEYAQLKRDVHDRGVGQIVDLYDKPVFAVLNDFSRNVSSI